MPQNTTEWAPSPKQAAVLEAAQQAGFNRSIVAICEEAHVDRAGFYRWLRQDPAFKAAWEDIWRGSIRRHLPGVVSAVLAKALVGDIPAARLIADLAAVLPTRIDARVQHEGHMALEQKTNTTRMDRFFTDHPEITNDLVDAIFATDT
jgi:hypothetical protein